MAPKGDRNGSRGRSRNRKGTVWEDEFPEDDSHMQLLKKAAADAQRVAAEAQRAVAAQELAETRGSGNSGARRGNNSPAPSNASGRGDLPGRRDRGLSASRFGKGGQNSRSSSVNTVGKSGKGSWPGVKKGNPKSLTSTPLAMVPEGEIREYAIGSGVNLRHAVNTTFGGGHQDRFMVPTATGGAIAQINSAEDAFEVVKRVKESSGADSMTIEVQPWKKGQLSFAKRKATNTKVIKSTGRSEVKALARGVELLSTKPGSSCIECNDDHALRDCLFAPKGYVYGCTLCNSKGHPVDSCNQFKDMSIKDQADLLVYERGNMPMLETSKDQPRWDWYLREYLKKTGKDAVFPKALPWTMEFAKEVGKRNDFLELQSRWDKDKNPDDLPKDPAHGSPEEIAASIVAGHIYPDRPSDLPQASDGQFPANTARTGMDIALDEMLAQAVDRRAKDAEMDQEQPEDDADNDHDMIK
ncbi:uncharacterized protein FIESC28_02112 [Fusarium coffeatum]|uniref:Uncharacterized protein n=1 Tax=Fusarium coffeatum TaxID=231269 RepID=A0A366S7A6_9HYPO|nr:uncharacterized protein FIESC28_02112 [Fusarium coffeatum]RBR25204.1 hypothetical protein FIESC28_02112 [Fusarium coffeatum]